jgi:hypothetical protein
MTWTAGPTHPILASLRGDVSEFPTSCHSNAQVRRWRRAFVVTGYSPIEFRVFAHFSTAWFG